MLYLSAADISRALPMGDAISVVEGAFVALSTGAALSPTRLSLPVAAGAVTLVMPALMERAFTVKAVSVHPLNRGGAHPVVQALVLLLDPANGVPLALLEGSSLTALRTGAASGAATRLLARPQARTAAFFGAGVQSRTQFAAIQAVRPLSRVWVYDRTLAKAEAFAAELPPSVHATAVPSPAAAIAEAEIICAATTSLTPVFDGRLLPAGCHINAVGSFTPAMREIDALTLQRASKLVVDSREAVWQEAGDLLAARQEGVISESSIHAELGEIAAGLRSGRESDSEITYFKSVGNAVQDAAAARAIYDRALALGLGVELT